MAQRTPEPESSFDYGDALKLFNAGQSEACVAMCRKPAFAGNAKAQFLLGQCHFQRVGFGASGAPPDRETAKGNDEEMVRLAKLSAEQDEPLGLYLLGLCYRCGRGGLPKDEKRAVQLFRRSAAHGCDKGQSQLGYVVRNGKGCTVDKKEGLRLSTMGARQGCGGAMRNTACFHSDPAMALLWYFKAATASEHAITEDKRKKSVSDCAKVAQKLTEPGQGANKVPSRHGTFITGIKACVQDAVAAAEASASHATHAFANFNQLRLDDPGSCDLTLCAGGADSAGSAASVCAFPCHRLVLRSASGYFQAVFGGDFAESADDRISLTDVEPAMLERLLEHIYTGKVEFTGAEDATAVLERAQFYQIDTLITACATYLECRVGAYRNPHIITSLPFSPNGAQQS